MFDFPIHSPIQKINQTSFFGDDVEINFKRDDMIHPFISGNKWRKLKYNLQEAKSQSKNKLVTFGGAYSNHLLATACAGALFGFKTLGLVRGEKSSELNDTLFLCQQFGMELNYLDRETYLNKKEFFNENYLKDQSAYFIDEGGFGKNGILGCEELVDELDIEYDYIFLASGTATTFAGIANACLKKALKTKVRGIVIHKGMEELKIQINQLIPDFELNERYHFQEHHLGGYAKTNSEYLAWCTRFSSASGILLDPVYTGKAVKHISELCKENYFKKRVKILFIHTGGLIGIMGKKPKYP